MSEILPDGLGPEARCRLLDALLRCVDAPSRQSRVALGKALLREGLPPGEPSRLMDLGRALGAYPASAWRWQLLREREVAEREIAERDGAAPGATAPDAPAAEAAERAGAGPAGGPPAPPVGGLERPVRRSVGEHQMADARVADALAAYLDAPGDDTRDELRRLAPEEGEWLVALGDCLRAFPRSAWRDVVLRPGDAAASDAPGEPAGTGPATEGASGARRPHAGGPTRPRSNRQCPPGTWRWRYWPSW